MRRKRGLSQQDVAERMGTTQSTISNFERVGGDARYSTLQRYARAVGVRLHSMVGHPGAALAPAWRLATEVPVRVAVRERDHGRLTREWTGQEHRSVRVR
ncbi:helix-turn-helix domain-containing protein [Kitasatospora sp. NPDC003701]